MIFPPAPLLWIIAFEKIIKICLHVFPCNNEFFLLAWIWSCLFYKVKQILSICMHAKDTCLGELMGLNEVVKFKDENFIHGCWGRLFDKITIEFLQCFGWLRNTFDDIRQYPLAIAINSIRNDPFSVLHIQLMSLLYQLFN